MAAPTLTFCDRLPPLAVLAVGKLSGVALELKPDGNLGKDAQPTLTFPTGSVDHFAICEMAPSRRAPRAMAVHSAAAAKPRDVCGCDA